MCLREMHVMMAAAASSGRGARFGCRASGGWEGRAGMARCVAYRCCAPRCGLVWQLANCCCAFQPHRERLMTMSTGVQTKHRATRASALNETWVEVNRRLGAVSDRVARAVERYVNG